MKQDTPAHEKETVKGCPKEVIEEILGQYMDSFAKETEEAVSVILARYREMFAKELIDAILDQSGDLCFALHYGIPSLLVPDIIHIINRIADTGYKQTGGGFLGFSDWGRYETDTRCEHCRNFFAKHDLETHREHCSGRKDASQCESYQISV